MVGLGTLLTSFGAVSDTRPDLLADGTRIGDKLGRETCVVSQVVADSLARLPLEGYRDTRGVQVSGESVCEEVHPCRVIIIYSNSRIPRIWKLGPLA